MRKSLKELQHGNDTLACFLEFQIQFDVPSGLRICIRPVTSQGSQLRARGGCILYLAHADRDAQRIRVRCGTCSSSSSECLHRASREAYCGQMHGTWNCGIPWHLYRRGCSFLRCVKSWGGAFHAIFYKFIQNVLKPPFIIRRLTRQTQGYMFNTHKRIHLTLQPFF